MSQKGPLYLREVGATLLHLVLSDHAPGAPNGQLGYTICFLSQDVADDPYMCSELKAVLGLSFKVPCVCVSTRTMIFNDRQNSFFIQATCPEFEYQTDRELREAVSISHTHTPPPPPPHTHTHTH